MRVNFFSKISVDSEDLTGELLDALDTDEFYFVFKWNEGPIAVLFQLDLLDHNDIVVHNYLKDAITSASGDISVSLKDLRGLEKGTLLFGIRAVDDIAKSTVLLIKEGPPHDVIKRIPTKPDKFEKIDAGSDFSKSEISFDL